MSVMQTGWSADGNWFWDGARWNDALSDDGKWRFDGASWRPFGGQRTPMPTQAPYAPVPPAPPAPPAWAGAQVAAAPAPPPPAPVAAAGPLPSWVDPSEVERMEGERRERDAMAAQPPPPLPPEADWRLVGERMQYSDYSHNAITRAGRSVPPIIIYIALLWFCGPISAIFVWMTGWSTTSKIICTCISLLGLVAALLLVFAAHYSSVSG